ncbi:hypothetical protein B1H10_00920 [candidate division KSB1 bacterium 4484_188]|nr:MAG: hypothetical protein B1H10_00920 [candidate division KSB1 bacterium 4484_188]HFE64572.1 hypothetical protein [Caldithrix sp.]
MDNLSGNQELQSSSVDILLAQLKKLSHADRVLLGLYFYEKLSIEEISVILSTSPRMVESDLERIAPYLELKPISTHESRDAFSEIFG